MKLYIKSSSEIDKLIESHNGTPGRMDSLRRIDWKISTEDAKKLIPNIRFRGIPIVEISYPNSTQQAKAQAKGIDSCFVFTDLDGNRKLYGIDLENSFPERNSYWLTYVGKA